MKFKDLRIWMYIFGLIALVAVYLYHQSKTHRSQLESQSIKAIGLAENNLLEAYYNYNTQLEGYLTRNIFDIVGGDVAVPASKLVQILDGESRFEILSIKLLNEEEKKSQGRNPPQIEVFHRDSTALLKVTDYQFSFSKKGLPLTTSRLNELENAIGERVGSATSVSPNASDGQHLHLALDYLIPLHQLMARNLQGKFFDHLMVLDESGKVLYPGKHKGLELEDSSSFLAPSGEESRLSFSLMHAGQHVIRLRLGSVTYESFLTSFFLGDRHFHLIGLKESGQFQRTAYRIDFDILAFLIAGLVLVFISIPVISIFNLSQGDILTRRRVVGVGFSLITLALVIGYTLAFKQNQASMDPDIEAIEQIGKDFSDQSTILLRQLGGIQAGTEPIAAITSFPSSKIKEYISFHANGDLATLVFPQNGDTLSLAPNPFINISERDYVREAVNAPDIAHISAQLSNATGEPEGVVSRFSQGEGRAITFENNGSFGADEPGHLYFIFRPDGKVLVRSKDIKMPVSELQHVIESGKLAEIQHLIANNDSPGQKKSWEVPVYVNGREYLALLYRLPLEEFTSSIWMMYLLDHRLEDTLFVLVSLETLAVLLPYFLVLITVTSFLLLAKPPRVYLNVTPFAFDWYRPTASKRDQFLFANYVLAFLVVMFVLVYLCIPLNIFSVFLWSAVFAVTACICNFILIHPQRPGLFGSLDFNFLAPSLFLWLLLASSLAYFSMKSLPGHLGGWCVAIVTALFLAMGLCFHFMRRRHFPRLKPDFSGQKSWANRLHLALNKAWRFITQLQVEKRIYALNFFLWIILLGFLPGYAVHRQVFYQEEFLWHHAKKNPGNVDGIRINKGIYSELIGQHEKLRRVNFSRLSNLEDGQALRYVAPNIGHVEASFALTKRDLSTQKNHKYPSFGNILSQKVDKKPFLLGLILILFALFFSLIMRISKRIYLTEFLHFHSKTRLPSKCVERKFNYVTGLDAMKIREWIFYHFQVDPKELLFVPARQDGIDFPIADTSHRVIVLEHIHLLKDVETLASTLDKFGSAYAGDSRVFFVTSGRSLQDFVAETVSPTEILLISEWMKKFIFYVVPLHFQQQPLLLPYDGKDWDSMSEGEKASFKRKLKSPLFNDPTVHEIANEINYGANTAALACLLTQELEADPKDALLSRDRYEKCILSIQRYNKAYYINIWCKLSMREKKLCYYFASEGFANYTNREIVATLLQKGVLVIPPSEERINFFSESFRNHILSNTSSEEHKKFRVDEKNHGNARIIQAASLSFVFITVALIGFYDPSILDRTVAYVSGTLGLVGTLYSFFHKGVRGIWAVEK